MTHRLSLAVALVSLLGGACSDSHGSAGSGGGAAHGGASGGAELGGASGGGANGVSGAASVGGGGASAGVSAGGVSAGGSGSGGGMRAVGGAAAGASAGQGGATAGFAGGGAGAGSGGDESAGSGGVASGVPEAWIPVTDIDYSIVPGPNFETVRLMFKATPCSGSNCHFGGRNHLQVDKTADQLYSYMLKLTTLQCGKLIDTAHPAESALVKYLRGPCGGLERMPYFTCVEDGDPACVPEYYIQFIEQWITNGAPR